MKRFVRIILGILLIAFIAITLGIIFNGYNMYKNALSSMPLKEKIESIQKKENYTKLEEIPQIYVDAVISVEDHRFYTHNGIDIVSIGRAIVNDIKAMDFVEGGSTITQQLAKNIYFTQEKKLTRKIAEVFMAFDLEKNYDKDEILELYINTSYYGDGYYTLKEASKGYFNKEVENMSDYECTMLAGIPNAPSVYAPTKNLDLAKQRQKQVIAKMIEYGYLTEQGAKDIINKGESE